MKLENRVAVVTGSGRGIGRSIALRLSRDGARVNCVDLDMDAARATAELCGPQATASGLDVADVAEVERLMSGVHSEQGRLDIVVNNAGVNRDAILHKMTDLQWHEVIRVDLNAVFYFTRAAARFMRKAESGRIINISSASWLGNIGQANYAAAKAGVVGLTRTAAKELGRFQATANVICPGFIDTTMTRSMPAAIRDAQIGKIPLGRAGDPSDVANVVSFLASDDASYVTGEVINVGGGYSI